MKSKTHVKILYLLIFLLSIFLILCVGNPFKKSPRQLDSRQNALSSNGSGNFKKYIASMDSDGNISSLDFPSGIILIWYPPNKDHLTLNLIKDDIPNGWAICDGENGTPDLRGRFVFMAQDAPIKDVPGSSSHQIRQIGGEETHILTISEMPSHNHIYTRPSPNGNDAGGRDGSRWNINGNEDPGTSSTGGSQAHNNMPPYYTLVYIMRL